MDTFEAIYQRRAIKHFAQKLDAKRTAQTAREGALDNTLDARAEVFVYGGPAFIANTGAEDADGNSELLHNARSSDPRV